MLTRSQDGRPESPTVQPPEHPGPHHPGTPHDHRSALYSLGCLVQRREDPLLGFRDVGKQLPPNADTIYGIGSITKIFTASAIGILVDEGLLDWTTPLREVLPEFHHRDNCVEHGLTISDLLAHKSGLATSTDWWYGAEGVLLLSKNQTIRSFGALKSVGPLRTRYDYSNWNYSVLGEVIERLSGLSYGAYLRAKILEPLGMSRTSVSRVSDQEEGNVALPYAVLDDYSVYALPFPRSEDGQLMVSAQAVRSTVNDLLKYMTRVEQCLSFPIAEWHFLHARKPVAECREAAHGADLSRLEIDAAEGILLGLPSTPAAQQLRGPGL